jgi:signal transduction histidine kinase/DNA-binding response OmpR family regulator
MPDRAQPARSLSGGGSIARSFVISTLAITSIALLALGTAAQVYVYEPARRALESKELGAAFDAVDAQLRQVIVRVEAIARVRRDWGASGLIDVSSPQSLVELVGPLLERGPTISSIAIASESGREVLLRVTPGGERVTRFTDPDRLKGKSIVQTWTPHGVQVASEVRGSDYDARRRPWFVNAQLVADPQAIYWTEPYTFVSTRLPGISAVVRWTGPDGTRYTSTSDIELTDLSRFTGKLAVGKLGFVTVFAQDGRVVGLPRDARFASDDALMAALLQPVADLGVPALSKSYRLWQEGGGTAVQALRFDESGVPWLASFRRIELGNQHLWVAALAPEADFSPLSAGSLGVFALLVLLALILAAVAAMRMAAQYSRPLAQLASESERIGRLELDLPVAVSSPWSELGTLAHAQEAMRTRLLAATRDLEATVEQRTADLVRARDAADQAVRAKAAFLANMSHEIRTPMNGIIGMTELALRAKPAPQQREYLGRIRDSADSLLRIINDILDFSKVDAGKLTLESTEFALDDVLRKVAQIVAPMAEMKGLELIVDRLAEVPNLLIGDAVRLEQVLVNLASNAVKFTPAGQVTIRVDMEEPGLESLRIRFAVRDTGIGIVEDRMRDLFQPFNQGDGSMARRFGGTGLGLAISRRLVELMGGRIGVESAPEQGSTFTFTARFGRAAAPKGAAGRAHALAGLRALAVDDNPTALASLVQMLRSFGLDVSGYEAGAPAVEAFARAVDEGRPYEVALIDRHMPDMDGLAVASALRGRRRGDERIFIMCTAADRSRVEPQEAGLRLAGYVTKPATPSSLLEDLLLGMGRPPHAKDAQDVAGRGEVPQRLTAGARVLVVEDNDINRIVASELLRAHGVDVATAGSGGEALARLGAGERFDLVFMDVQMPGMDGFEATRSVRALPGGASMTIVAMTAHAMAGDRERCLAAGMDDYIAKPVSPAALAQCLQRWLGKAAREPGDA